MISSSHVHMLAGLFALPRDELHERQPAVSFFATGLDREVESFHEYFRPSPGPSTYGSIDYHLSIAPPTVRFKPRNGLG